MKKVLTMLLAAVMIFTLIIPAAADVGATSTTATITISDFESNHTYTAYQIFKGTVSEADADGNYTLSDIEWGDDIDSDAFLAALVAATWENSVEFTATMTAAEIAQEMKGSAFSDDGANTKQFAQLAMQYMTGSGTELTSGSATVAVGYYVIADTIDSETTDDVVSEYILEVVGDVTVTTKKDIPTVTKTVSTTEITDDDSDSDDSSVSAAIGDTVYFELKATIADNYASYTEGYEITFNDTLSTGLTYTTSSSHVYLVNDTTWTELTIDNNLVSGSYVGQNLTYTIDVAGLVEESYSIDADSLFVVVYAATLNENADMGNSGNINTVYLTYSNDPYTTDTGTSTSDNAVVFTYQFIVVKVDEDGSTALEGAGFTLYKATDDTGETWETTGITVDPSGTGLNEFVFEGLDEGYYKLVETTVPDGYNKADDIIFKISATIADEEVTALVAYTGDPSLADANFVSDLDEGSLTLTITNEKGSILPSTGGIGTTIFYVVGGILVIGAAVLLITKKRMSAK